MIRPLLRGIDYLLFDLARAEHVDILDRVHKAQATKMPSDGRPQRIHIPSELFRRNPDAELRALNKSKDGTKAIVILGVLTLAIVLLMLYLSGFIPALPNYRGGVPRLLIVGPPVLVWYSAKWVYKSRKRSRLRKALRERCPSCHFDLKGHGNDLSPSPVFAERTGPARCPECGFAWPFVP